jgi:crotonobetainyl-CoA:carnitine CoA-transferase CaiB-like acyl-CoA transferase
MEKGALDGVTVLELGARVAAGVCGSLLAQLGATVVLVEGLPHGAGEPKWDRRAQAALGKLSLRPDLSDPDEREVLARLVARADVVLISSDVDGALHTLPEGWREGRLVCDFTAYGESGRPDGEAQIQAVTGIIDTTGSSGSAPVLVPLPIVETMTGLYGASGVIAALRVVRRTGLTQPIDMSLYDCAFAAMATFLPRILAGAEGAPQRIGNNHAMISPWNVFQARDGWVLICAGTDVQWRRLCGVMGQEELAADPRYERIADRVRRSGEVDAAVQDWTARHSVDECVARLSAISIACGPVAEIAGHPDEPNLLERGMIRRVEDAASGAEIAVPGSPLRMTATPGRVPGRISAPDGDRAAVLRLAGEVRSHPRAVGAAEAALAGVRIIEIGHYTTAPLATKHLAALGAEVIKIEPPEGEATRAWPPTQDGQGIFFTYMNSDKQSLVLDLNLPEHVEELRELLRTADVLVENLKPGALAKRGFAYEQLREINPRLVYCSVSGFGAVGLYPGRPAFDTVIQAMSGLMDVVRCDGIPMKTGISTADLSGAQFSTVAILAALEHRDATGEGQWIDLSMQDTTAWLTQWAWNGAGAADEWSLAACSDGFAVVKGPQGGEAALTRAGLVAALARAGQQAAPVLTASEMMEQPLPEARGLWFRATGNGREWPLLKTPVGLALTPPLVRRPMPPLGRDTVELLASKVR